MNPAERARALFDSLEKQGVPPFEDLGWMNEDDRGIVRDIFAAAIREAINDALERAALRAEGFGLESEDDAPGTVRAIAAAIRALKEQP